MLAGSAMKRRLWLVTFLVACVAASVSPEVKTSAQETRAGFPDGHPLKALQTLDGYFPFHPPTDLSEWIVRSESLRQHLQISLGIWPLPERTPLEPVIHGRQVVGACTIEKVSFQSMPGFFVTGNLYRPAAIKGRMPGVLCPHGHWPNGRFMWADDAEVQRQLDAGAETFPNNARSPLQARCIHLAEMGCVVFHYDMVGYADCTQIPMEVAHGFHAARPHMNGPGGWGFFSPRAEMRLQSIAGLQTWNSIRSLDFLASLPDVDPGRIGVTGASGGGTQTFLLGALDARPTALFPAVMVSTAMQGGCTCENCCNLRVRGGNVEFAALAAPRPLGLTAANDWTHEMETKGFPELQALYQLYYPAAEPPLELTARIEFGHNYNQISREAMYRFMNRYLCLGLNSDQIHEHSIEVQTADALGVYDSDHPRPAGGEDFERELLKTWERLGDPFRNVRRPLDRAAWNQMSECVRTALGSMVSHPQTDLWTWSGMAEEATGPVERSGQLKHPDGTLFFPVAFLRTGDNPGPGNRGVCIVAGPGIDATGRPAAGAGSDSDALATPLPLHSAAAVVALDWWPGTPDANGLAGNRLVDNGREAAGYTFGYNRTLFAWRVSQLLWLIERLSEDHPGQPIAIHASGESAAAAIVARALAHVPVELVVDLQGFRFGEVADLRDANFFPGAVKYGDVDAFLACRADAPLTLLGESPETMPLTAEAFASLGTTGLLRFEPARERAGAAGNEGSEPDR
jgi:hypothetical protein